MKVFFMCIVAAITLQSAKAGDGLRYRGVPGKDVPVAPTNVGVPVDQKIERGVVGQDNEGGHNANGHNDEACAAAAIEAASCCCVLEAVAGS